jgi:hypothetical protein
MNRPTTRRRRCASGDQGALAACSSLTTKKGALRKKLFIPEIGRSLSLEGRLAVALNWGNELNRARIMDGDKWTEPTRWRRSCRR